MHKRISEKRFCMINLSESSFLVNRVLSILLQHKIVVIVLRPSAALPVSPRSRSGYRQAAKPGNGFSNINKCALRSIYQPFQVLQLTSDRSGSLSGVSVWCLLYRPVFSWSGATRLKDIVLIG